MFLNYKTVDENEKNIITRISNELKVAENDISLELKDTKIHQKYSVSDQKNKCYEHKLYYAHISNIPEEEKMDSFRIEGRRYYWMTIAEMENNSIIMEKNSDIVAYVKELIQ